MKIKLLLLIFFTTQLFSLTIVLNSAKASGKPYAVLHIEDSELVNCQTLPQDLDKEVYLCKFNKIVKTPIDAKKMPLVDIDFLEKEKEFYIRITPKVKSHILKVQTPLYKSKEVSSNNVKKLVNHWSIFLYEKPLYPSDPISESINFPVIFSKNLKPSIGALDLNGAPISYVQSKDIGLYLDLKRKYKNKKYLDVIEDSKDTVGKYPNTIFKSEFLLYRLRALSIGLDENIARIANSYDRNEIVSEGKAWIKAFPSDSNIPEVLMLIAKAYLKMGFKSDANYFLDILISEHENSSFTKKAILVFADSLYNSRKKDKAIKLYLDVLYSAKDLDIASEAAIRLSDKEINRGKNKEAKIYLLKVLDANKEYLLKDKKESYKLAKKLALNGLYNTAAKVADVILSGMKKRDEIREDVLKDSGIWHAKANDVEEAYNMLEKYLKEYKYGNYREEVQAALDELFFELKETNTTKLAKYYDELIKKYNNKIGDRAVLEKAKLLLSQKRYADVLKMQKSLEYASDNNSTVKEIIQAASALTKISLKNSDCDSAVGFIEKYSLELNKFDKDLTFNCLIRTSRYAKAKELSEQYIKIGSLKNRKIWLENYILALYRLNKYKKVEEVGDDILKISKSIKENPSRDTLQMIFFSYIKLAKFEKAIEIAKYIDKLAPNDLKNADVFIEIIKRAKDDRNDLLLVEYANKIIALQKKYKANAYTPEVELSLIGALQRLDRVKDALTIAEELIGKEISLKQKIRAYYSAGELSMKLNQNSKAKEYFTKCKNINVDSSWKDICEQNLKLL